jgi:hypothetical protein
MMNDNGEEDVKKPFNCLVVPIDSMEAVNVD